MRVFVVEDSSLIRKRIIDNVKGLGNFDVVGFAESEQEAVDAYQKAIALNPRNAEAFRELGLAQMKLNQPGAAVASLQQSARLDPENPETQKDLGDVYTAMGNSAGAQVAFRKSEELKKAAAK